MLDVFGVNILGPIRMLRCIYPMMISNNQENDSKSNQGIVINVASAASYSAVKFTGFYSTTKFALYGFSDGLRREFKSIQGLRVTCIEPGFSKTAILNLKPQADTEFGRIGVIREKKSAAILRNAQPPKVIGDAICEQIFSSNNLPHLIIDYWYMRLVYLFLYYTGLDL